MPAISVVYRKEASVTAGCFRRNRLEAFTDGQPLADDTTIVAGTAEGQ